MDKRKRQIHPPHYSFKAYLAGHGIKLKDVADLLNITVQSVSQKNNGYQNYTIPEINTICDRYEISADIFRFKKVS